MMIKTDVPKNKKALHQLCGVGIPAQNNVSFSFMTSLLMIICQPKLGLSRRNLPE